MTTSNNNLFLIGMMGSWKSTVGRELSKVMDMEFVDTDDAIEEITEMKVADIFREFGEKRFREMEKAFFIEKAKQVHKDTYDYSKVDYKNNKIEFEKKGGTFRGSSLQNISCKENSGDVIQLMYDKEDWEGIEDYIRKETKCAIETYRQLLEHMKDWNYK